MTHSKISEDQFVSWRLDEIDVEATLVHPAEKGRSPAVIMVAGSGPTDRNWNSPLMPGTNGSAALLARTLAEIGFISLRYDKRVSGPHVKENAARLAGKISLQSHLDELAGGVKLLAGLDEVDSNRIFALTNSEGGIHAMNYQIQANELPFAGLVLTAPPARPVGEVARAQVAAQLRGLPGGDKWLAAFDSAMSDFSVGRSMKVDESFPEGLRTLILSVTNPANQPFAHELWALDPAALLVRIKVPVLVVIGKKDLQVDWQVDGSIIDQIAKTHDNITAKYPQNANHVLKYEQRDRSQLVPAEAAAGYNADESKLDEEGVRFITSWLISHN
jgi:pimeloyl-ACP methyl ester carboxylesterase